MACDCSISSGAVVVRDEEVEVAGLHEALLQPREDERGVALGDLRHQHTDGVGAAPAQGAREQVGPVVELPGGSEDAILRGLRDAPAAGDPLSTRETAAEENPTRSATILRLVGLPPALRMNSFFHLQLAHQATGSVATAQRWIIYF